ncbi:hypothetical protein [Candidatus Magnetominusculus xianensis]|uniref:Secreted protein n=1 Tax=Candidatus Magnetominusculus xianensis TaxID=1748249 RepID=A0ABR5SH56_9BACT|nr:hypothetical protein [Candidatus Magnetominusculus xianensis]KWT91031.1 hypothetical protein ASN18_0978 [Candidatus Magnetominusculus xianensis]MBF0402576.1 hypothetical protein [Nitrospirota bacterium]
MKYTLLYISMLVVLSIFGVSAAGAQGDENTGRYGNPATVENLSDQGTADKTTGVSDKKETITPKVNKVQTTRPGVSKFGGKHN